MSSPLVCLSLSIPSPRLSFLVISSLLSKHSTRHLRPFPPPSLRLLASLSSRDFLDANFLQEVSLWGSWCPGPSHRHSQGSWLVSGLVSSGLHLLPCQGLHGFHFLALPPALLAAKFVFVREDALVPPFQLEDRMDLVSVDSSSASLRASCLESGSGTSPTPSPSSAVA